MCSDSKSRTRSSFMRATLIRSLWAALCLVHIAPLISTTTSLFQHGWLWSDVLNCLLLWLTFSFFALKFLDVSWLRWRVTRANILVSALACGMAHHDVASGQSAQAVLAETPAAVAVSLLWEFAKRTRRTWVRLRFCLANHAHWAIGLLQFAFEAALNALALLLRQKELAFITIPRAPPTK
jgi:hypothetical protein